MTKPSLSYLRFLLLLNLDLNLLSEILIWRALPVFHKTACFCRSHPSYLIPQPISHSRPCHVFLWLSVPSSLPSLFSEMTQECCEGTWWLDGRDLPAWKKKYLKQMLWVFEFCLLSLSLWREIASISRCKYALSGLFRPLLSPQSHTKSGEKGRGERNRIRAIRC